MKHSTAKFRRVMALVLALLLVVGLTGCIGKGNDDPTDPPAAADPTTAPTEAPTAPTEAPTEKPTEAPEKGVMGTVSANNLNVRSNHASDSAILSQLPVNLRVEILEQKTVGGTNWGRIGEMTLPNGTKIDGGWLNLHYVKLDTDAEDDKTTTGTDDKTTTVDPDEEALGTITAQQLQIRKGAGTTYDTAGSYKKGDRVKILEQKTVSGTTWGRTEKGWISMTYVKLDGSAGSATDTGTNVAQPGATTPTTAGSSSGTGTSSGTAAVEVSNNKTTVLGYVVVDVDGLTLRTGPGTKYKSLGTADEGDRYPYYQTSGGWYRTSHGWLSNADDAYLYIEGTTADDAGIAKIKAKEMYVRQGPGTNFKSVTTLKEGESLVVLGRSDGWGYTRLGWINIDTDYVEFTSGLTYTTFIGSAEVLADGLNVREGASTDTKSKDSLDKGDKVTVTALDATNKNWGAISYGSGKTGYINLSYVKMTSSTSTETPTTPPAPTYKITIADVTHGKVTASATTAAEKTVVTLTITPDTGYELATLEVKKGTETVVHDSKYQFIMPNGDVTVTATFAEAKSDVKLPTTLTGGTVAADQSTNVPYWTQVTLTVNPDAGYKDPVVSVTDAKGNAQTVDKVSEGVYTFKMPDSDATVSVSFTKIKYKVNSNTPTNGTFTVVNEATVGDTVVITPTANENYEVGEVKYGITVITAVEGKYSFTMPAADVTVSVTFNPVTP